MSPNSPCHRYGSRSRLPDGVSQATIGVRGGLLRSGFEETSEALYLTSGYVYESARDAEKAFTGEIDRFVYSRYGNPTIAMFEERLRLIEDAPAAFATASGMAAVFTSLGALLGAGDRLVAARSLFGSCFVVCSEILPRWGVEVVFVDGEDLSQWEEALSVPTQAVFFETPSNPMQSLVDIAAVCDLAHAAGAKVVLDNVFATPLLQQGLPARGGRRRVLRYQAHRRAGTGSRRRDPRRQGVHRRAGAEAHAAHRPGDQRLQCVDHVEGPGNHGGPGEPLERIGAAGRGVPAGSSVGVVGEVPVPGVPSAVRLGQAADDGAAARSSRSSCAGGNKERAFEVLDKLRVIDISNNLGDAKSLITHPATTTHRAMGPEGRAAIGLGDAVVRVSIGLEGTEDLIADLDQALS